MAAESRPAAMPRYEVLAAEVEAGEVRAEAHYHVVGVGRELVGRDGVGRRAAVVDVDERDLRVRVRGDHLVPGHRLLALDVADLLGRPPLAGQRVEAVPLVQRGRGALVV